MAALGYSFKFIWHPCGPTSIITKHQVEEVGFFFRSFSLCSICFHGVYRSCTRCKLSCHGICRRWSRILRGNPRYRHRCISYGISSSSWQGTLSASYITGYRDRHAVSGAGASPSPPIYPPEQYMHTACEDYLIMAACMSEFGVNLPSRHAGHQTRKQASTKQQRISALPLQFFILILSSSCSIDGATPPLWRSKTHFSLPNLWPLALFVISPFTRGFLSHMCLRIFAL